MTAGAPEARGDGPVLALVPARGGSQGIPRKNMAPVAGRPLIWWSIRHGLDAATVDRVVVSTDDEEIAAVARDAGAEVPFQRPAALAGHRTTDLPVFQHALRWLAEEEGFRPELVVHLRPTSPARRPGLVDEAVALLRGAPDASSVRSVSRCEHRPHKMWWIDEGGHLDPVCGTLDEELFNEPRQALPQAWVQDGVIDVIRAPVIEGGSMTGLRIIGLPLADAEGVDVDRPEDLPGAEAAVRRLGWRSAEGSA